MTDDAEGRPPDTTTDSGLSAPSDELSLTGGPTVHHRCVPQRIQPRLSRG